MNYLKAYCNLIRKAEHRVLPEGYTEKHHIFPKSIYGNNNKIVVLTAREHYIAHKLLTYIYPNNRKIATAFHYMTFGKTYYNQSSRDYEYARKLASFSAA